MQSVELNPDQSVEPEGYTYDVLLQGAGAGVVPVVTFGKGVAIARTGAGAYTLSFAADPGPNFLGGGEGFGDSAAAANVLGWSVAFGVYTKAANGAQAKLTFTIGNAANAAADPAATSSVKLGLRFKLGRDKE